MKLKKAILPLLALVLVMSLTIPPALAYFTDTTRAKGGYTIRQSATTSIDESFKNWTKSITITNTEGEPVFVRARAFAGETFTLTYSGRNWEKRDDGWYYYSGQLAAGQSAKVLKITISNIPDATENASFNVAVVYESTPVQYDADGKAYADWDMILDRGGEQG